MAWDETGRKSARVNDAHRAKAHTRSRCKGLFSQPQLVFRIFFFLIFCFLWYLETVASWQHCFDHNTGSARLSKLGTTLAAQVFGGQLPPTTKQGKASFAKARPLQSTFPNSGSPKCGQVTCATTVEQPRKHSLVTLERRGVFDLWLPRFKDGVREHEGSHPCHLVVE